MLAMGVPPQTVAAYMSEQLQLILRPPFYRVTTEVPFQGTLKQEGRDAPTAWDALLFLSVFVFVASSVLACERFRDRGLGISPVS